MLAQGHRLIIVILTLCVFFAACSSGSDPLEGIQPPERTASLEGPSAEPTGLETSAPSPNGTSMPAAPASETPTPTQAAIIQTEIYAVTDEFDAVEYYLPVSWDEYALSPWIIEDQVVGSSISASSDLNAYLNWGASGVSIYVSRRLDKGYLQIMDDFRNIFAESCDEYLQTWEYESDIHRGREQRFWRCGGEDGPTLDLAALVNKEDWQAYTAVVVIVWFYPVEYQLTEDYLLNFMVIPENLP